MNPAERAPQTLPWAPLAAGFTAMYGLPGWTFREMMFFGVPGETAIYAVIAGAEHPRSREALLNLGWRALDAPWPAGRPTASFLAVIGADATRNVLDVDETEALRFRAGEPLTCPAGTDAAVLVVRRGKRVIGGVDATTGRAVDP